MFSSWHSQTASILAGNATRLPSVIPCHCEERSDVAIRSPAARRAAYTGRGSEPTAAGGWEEGGERVAAVDS